MRTLMLAGCAALLTACATAQEEIERAAAAMPTAQFQPCAMAEDVTCPGAMRGYRLRGGDTHCNPAEPAANLDAAPTVAVCNLPAGQGGGVVLILPGLDPKPSDSQTWMAGDNCLYAKAEGGLTIRRGTNSPPPSEAFAFCMRVTP